jgi:fluoroacetyl-CoA thioesterase
MEVTANIPVGTAFTKTVTVTRDMTVAHFHDNMPEVYGTPMMIYLMEVTATEAVQPFLPQGWVTVGTQVNVSHMAATPVGFTVTARAEVLSVDGRLITFAVEAHDGVEQIGAGKHTRAAIDLGKFESRVKMKSKPG